MTDEELRLIGIRIPNAPYVCSQAGNDLRDLYSEVVRLRGLLGMTEDEAMTLESKVNGDMVLLVHEATRVPCVVTDWSTRIIKLYQEQSSRADAYWRGVRRLKRKLDQSETRRAELVGIVDAMREENERLRMRLAQARGGFR